MSRTAGAAMTNSQPVAETFQEELKIINEKGKEFKGEQRDFYRSIVQRVENNVQVLADLREEHTSLRSKLGELVKEKNSRLQNVNLAGDLKHMDHEVNLLKRQIDKLKHLKEKSINRQRELEVILANFKKAEVSEHPEEKRIRDMKNQLDKANIKNSEATHLVKIYQQIIYYLDRQKMRWNPILVEKQDIINKKNRDISELNFIARDSKYSKTLAVSEYYRTEEQCIQARKKRDAILDAKKEQAKANNNRQMMEIETEQKVSRPQPSLNSQPSVLRNKLNKAAREKREERYRQVSTVYEEIRDRFGTNEPEQIEKFFTERKENTDTLEKQIQALKADCSVLEKKANHLKSALEEAEYASSKGVGGNRLLAEGQKILTSKQENLKEVQKQMAALETHQKSVISGIQHLSEVMAVVQNQDEVIPEDPEELLNYYLEKSKRIKTDLDDDDADFTTMVNVQALVSHIARTEVDFDMERADQPHHLNRRNYAEHKRTQKEKPGDIQTRVLDRAQVKMNALKAVQLHQQQKKRERTT
ncbi:hypothetical protein TRFO_26631 [Tritrichomonas foetus]|uniref:Uncharacterized protein n=1 Tax=Tritrichomonas foetus TaxID=1144522 RepID=A0A1J4K779_9EUKA|nr:hypothetical protein TRFO_26631 [Tritrichomonas foetus]|eukprot:OHT05564.1 hypothetical protein TRFO_26631 [Tritrichomonas foetus]